MAAAGSAGTAVAARTPAAATCRRLAGAAPNQALRCKSIPAASVPAHTPLRSTGREQDPANPRRPPGVSCFSEWSARSASGRNCRRQEAIACRASGPP
jgi:hypothetical protein